MIITIVFGFLIGFLIANNILTMKYIRRLKSQIKEQDRDIKKAFEQISGILNTHNKTIRLIQKLKSHIGKEISNILHDLNNIYGFSAKHTETINKIMGMHNDLVDSTFEIFKDIYCDLNDCDCSICSYHDYCSGITEPPEKIKEESTNNDSSIACEDNNKIIIDLRNNDAFSKLEKAMINSGVPKEVVDNYVTYIKETCRNFPDLMKDKTLEIGWQFGKDITIGSGGLIRHRFVKENKSEEKLIDPNSKIVKTLNKLYEKRDN